MRLILQFASHSYPYDKTFVTTWVNHINSLELSNTSELEIVNSTWNGTLGSFELVKLIETLESHKLNTRTFIPRRGWKFDGVDCFVYGAYYEDSNDDTFFDSADAATQLVMNNCGYSNECLTKVLVN